MRKSVVASRLFSAACVLIPIAVHAQDAMPEVSELHRRVAVMRTNLPQITAAADYAADLFTRDTAARFLVSRSHSKSTYAEFFWHTGASPGLGDADGRTGHGIVLYPVRAWEENGLAAAMLVDRWKTSGLPAITIGSALGKPTGDVGRWMIDNGAPDGGRSMAPINGIANLVAEWTLYAEFVAAATRRGWQPGIFVSNLTANADDLNSHLAFRAPPGRAAVAAIPAGQLGAQYLAYVDSLLVLATRPPHQALMHRAADSLRARRAGGHKLFVGACANYLQSEIAADTAGSPFIAVDGQWDAVGPLMNAGARAGDGILWFGYQGYDCPHVLAEQALADANFRTVTISDDLPARPLKGVMVTVPLSWSMPEHAAAVPFHSEGVGSASSIDALVHYLWIKRLVAAP